MPRFMVTEEELKRYSVLDQVIQGSLTAKEASQLLGLSYRQTLRLKKRFKQEGWAGILRKSPPKPPNLKFSPATVELILKLRRELYYDFNILHFRDKLREIHGLSLSYESLRQILIKGQLHEPRRRKRIYRRRRRMPQAGLLVQMDSSQHRWLESVKEAWWLVAMCDDADSYVYAEFHPRETTQANMQVIKRFLEQRGLFMALYVDKASHFKTTRHGGLHYEVRLEHKETQIQRALKELNIAMIPANSPQAKGRIERLFRFFQDRLIKEMRLKGIKDYNQANQFLQEEFLPWYNKNYTLEVESAYKALPKKVNLELIFSIKEPRKVNKDNTISYQGKIYQLIPANGIRTFSGKWVEVCRLLNGNIQIIYSGKSIPYLLLRKKKGGITKAEEILNQRKYLPDRPKPKYKPPQNHPWRNFYYGKNVSF